MDILYEDSEASTIKYISFIGESSQRFDIAILHTDRFYGKLLVIDIQSGRTAIIGTDDLDEEGYLEHAFHYTQEEAKDLYEYLYNYLH